MLGHVKTAKFKRIFVMRNFTHMIYDIALYYVLIIGTIGLPLIHF